MPTVLYCHGFLSSSHSTKAQQVRAWLAEHRPDWIYHCPELSAYPQEAHQTLNVLAKQLIAQGGAVYCIGSSLGGYWATALTEQYGFKCVLVNPAVAPHTRFTHYIGQALKSYYSEDHYTLSKQDLHYLEEHDCPVIRRETLYYILLQTGDQTLDYRHAQARYRGCTVLTEEGGNHSFVGFEQHLPNIIQFFEVD